VAARGKNNDGSVDAEGQREKQRRIGGGENDDADGGRE
jgi:hypothetical protein